MRKSIFTSLSRWISLLRYDEPFDIKFVPCVKIGSTVNIITNEPVPDVTNGVSAVNRVNRKSSHIEIGKSSIRSAVNTSVLNNRKK